MLCLLTPSKEATIAPGTSPQMTSKTTVEHDALGDTRKQIGPGAAERPAPNLKYHDLTC